MLALVNGVKVSRQDTRPIVSFRPIIGTFGRKRIKNQNAMKKTILFSALLFPLLLIVGCTKDGGTGNENEEPTKPKFDYELTVLRGRWRVTHADLDGKGYTDVTKLPFSLLGPPTYITFLPDWTYKGEGLLARYGNGTYTAEGKTVTCLSGEKVVATCNVLSLAGNECEMAVRENGDPTKETKVKCRKE